MHLHHELQRALAETKIDATTPLPAGPDEDAHRERARALTRRVPLLLRHRTDDRGGRVRREASADGRAMPG